MGRPRRLRYRHLRRTAIAALAAIALLLVAVVGVRLAVETKTIRHFVKRRIEVAVGRAVDGRLSIGSLAWGYWPPTVRCGDVELDVASLHLQAESVAADLARFRVARRTVELGTVVVDGVVVEIRHIPESRSRSGDSWVKVRVRHLDLRRLELAEGTLPGGTSVSLKDISAAWATDSGTPRGFLRIRDAGIDVPGLEPITTSFQARFILGETLELPRLRAENPSFRLTGEASLSAAGEPRLDVEGEIELQELDRVVHAGGVLDGRCRLSLKYDPTLEDAVSTIVSIPHAVAAGFPLDDVRGRITLRDGRLSGNLEHSVFHHGILRGSYTVDRLAPPFAHRVELAADGIDVASLLTNIRVPPAGISAAADVNVDVSWNGRSIKRGEGQGTAKLSPVDGAVPSAGDVTLRLTPDSLLHFAATGLQMGSSIVSWQGPLRIGTWEPAWSIDAVPAHLPEILPMINTWVGSEVLPSQIEGSGNLHVDLAGPWRQLHVGLRLDANPIAYPPIRLDRLVAEAVIENSTLTVRRALYRIGDGSGDIDGHLSWGAGAESGFNLGIRGQAIPLDQVAQWVGGAGLHGLGAFAGHLHGPLNQPRGSWALAIRDPSFMGQALGDGAATVELADGAFTVRGAEFVGGLRGGARWQVFDGMLETDLVWEGMPLDALGTQTVDLLGAQADVSTSFQWPFGGRLSGRLEIRNAEAKMVATADTDIVRVEGHLADAVAAVLDLARRPDGTLEGEGELWLVSAGDLLHRLSPAAQVPLEGSGHARFAVSWPEGRWPSIAGQLETLEMALGDRPVLLIEPADFSASVEDGLRVNGLYLSLLGDEVSSRFSFASDGTLKGNVSGILDALLLRLVAPEWEPAGRVTGVVEMFGTLQQPRLDGIAEVHGGSFRLPGSQTVVSGIDGTIVLSADEMILEGMGFRFMNGTGRGGGRIRLVDGTVELALRGAMDGLAFALVDGLQPRVSGNWRLQGPVDDLELSGEITVDRAALRRKDELTTILYDWFGGPPRPVTGGSLKLNLRVAADGTLEASTPFLRVNGSAQLAIGGTAARPGLVGKLEFLEGGDFTFQGVRYELDRATVTFSDPIRIDPIVDMEARAWVQNYQITVRLTGTADRLTPVLTSDPPLPEPEIISLLAMGSRNEQFGTGAIGVGVASSILTRQLNIELEKRARSLLALDQVRVDPFTESSTGNPTARVTVVKQLSPTWTVMLQSNLSTNRQEVIVSRWFLRPGLFLEATRDVDGTLSLDIKQRRRY